MSPSLFSRPRTVRVPVDSGQVAIQQVRVTSRARPLVRRFVTTVLITYCVASTLSVLVSDDLKKLPKGKTAPSDHWTRQHEALSKLPSSSSTSAAAASSSSSSSSSAEKDPQTIQMMVPIWFRRPKRPMLRPEDRAWQDYRNMMADGKHVQEVHRKLTMSIVNSCAQRRDLKPWYHWIGFTGHTSIRFEMAPQLFDTTDYEVPCVRIKPNQGQIEFDWVTLSHKAGSRIERIFHPGVFAHSFYAAYRSFLHQSMLITKAKLTKALSAPQQQQQQGQKQAKKDGSKEDGKEKDDNQLMKLPGFDGFSSKAHLAHVESLGYRQALDAAREAFKNTMVSRRSKQVQKQTPGICYIHGMVMMKGTRGQIRLNVNACYSPAARNFVGLPVITGYMIIPNEHLGQPAPGSQQRQQQKAIALPGPGPGSGAKTQSTPSQPQDKTQSAQPSSQPSQPQDKTQSTLSQSQDKDTAEAGRAADRDTRDTDTGK